VVMMATTDDEIFAITRQVDTAFVNYHHHFFSPTTMDIGK
jgi:hypothetical protein